MGALGAMGEGLIDPEANPVIFYSLALSYLIKSNIQPSATSARISSFSASSAGTISEGSACAFSVELVGALSSSSAGAFSAGSAGAFSAGSAGELLASDAFSACAPSAGSVSDVHTSKGKLPVEPVSLARSKRLEGVHRQYVVAELFPSISDTEDDDGVEFCWRDEAQAGGGEFWPEAACRVQADITVFVLTKRRARYGVRYGRFKTAMNDANHFQKQDLYPG